MHALSFASVLALALSAAALQVTTPSNSSGWVSSGTNTLAWNRVDTDPTNFTVILTNTDRTVLPTNNLLLDSFVDATSANSISIPPPSGGLPVGGTFRVNLIKDQNDISSIYAQSDEFTITSGGSVSTSSSSSGTISATGTTVSLSNTATGSPTSTGTGSASGTDSGINPTTSANSGASNRAQYGMLGLSLVAGVMLA